MQGVNLVEKLAEMQKHFADAHRPVRSPERYRERHARRQNYDGERHVSQYQARQ